MKKNYRKTLIACYLGFITQAITANFAPLLFLKFHADYGISLGRIALIPTAFFLTQILIDVFCARFVDRIGYRRCVVISEIACGAGLSRRGYRTWNVTAPLSETLGAGIVLLSRYYPDLPLFDPMCGSGTMPIEAAMIAQNRAPGGGA